MGGTHKGNNIFARKLCIQTGGNSGKRASLFSGGGNIGLEEILEMGTECLLPLF